MLFAIIALTLFLIMDVKTKNFTAVAEEKESLDKSFNRAIDDAVAHLVETDGITNLKVNRERAVTDFFASMYAAMDTTDKPDKQELLKNYVPVITVTCDDGYYLYYSEEYKGSDNYTYFSKRWSEKLPYYYEDEDFIYGFTLTNILSLYDKNGLLDATKEKKLYILDYHELATSENYSHFRVQRPNSFLLNDESFYLTRKNSVITGIENSMAYYCNKHNLIAQQLGITYNFAMPIVDNSEWTRSIDDPCIIIMFQGYPFKNGIEDTYNRFAIAGARIKKSTVYYLEQKEWYYLYHKNDCVEFKKDGIFFLEEPYYTVFDCAKKGAYACPICNETGVYAPDYHTLVY